MAKNKAKALPLQKGQVLALEFGSFYKKGQGKVKLNCEYKNLFSFLLHSDNDHKLKSHMNGRFKDKKINEWIKR